MTMKKNFIVLLAIFSILLCACDPATFNFNYDNMVGEVTSIELIKYNNNNSDIIDIKNDTRLIFLEEKVISSKKIDQKSNCLLLKDLSNITFHLENISTKEPVGECLKINLNNGNFYILSATLVDDLCYSMVAEFDQNYNFVRHIAYFADRPSYEVMIDKYFAKNQYTGERN